MHCGEEGREEEVEGRLRREEEAQMDGEPQDEEMDEINLVEVRDLIGKWCTEIQQVQTDEIEEEMNMEKA